MNVCAFETLSDSLSRSENKMSRTLGEITIIASSSKEQIKKTG